MRWVLKKPIQSLCADNYYLAAGTPITYYPVDNTHHGDGDDDYAHLLCTNMLNGDKNYDYIWHLLIMIMTTQTKGRQCTNCFIFRYPRASLIGCVSVSKKLIWTKKLIFHYTGVADLSLSSSRTFLEIPSAWSHSSALYTGHGNFIYKYFYPRASFIRWCFFKKLICHFTRSSLSLVHYVRDISFVG